MAFIKSLLIYFLKQGVLCDSAGNIWEILETSAQFCHKLETALKNKSYLKGAGVSTWK